MKSRPDPKSRTRRGTEIKVTQHNNLEKFLEKVRRDEFPIGAVVGLADPTVTELAANVGFDFVFIDGEHGDIDRKCAMEHLMAVKGDLYTSSVCGIV